MTEIKHTICRACHAGCGVLVEIDNGRPISTKGNPDDPLFKGFCCIKGQNFHSTRNNPNRLLRSQKRQADGSYIDIPVEQAMDEIAEKIQNIMANNGRRSLATYSGTMAANGSAANSAMSSAWLKATGSRMGFNSNTIDQPGKMVAAALHGKWMAPEHNFAQAKVIMLIGVNPLVAMSGGIPHSNPGRALTDAMNNGLELIVVDPRRTETARRATLFLQVKPGRDPLLLAAMINTIFTENLHDHDFTTQHVDGLTELSKVVSQFPADKVADLVGVKAQQIIEAARLFANGKMGVATAGTGPNMSGNTTLIEYLLLSLNTICGRWQRAGEKVFEPTSLGQPTIAKAQALPPYPEYAYGFGEKFRVRQLSNTAAGLPTAALADEILLPGEGQVKALICHGGNPVAAWPDQLKTISAMKELELLVQIDVTQSATARMADYVIAVKHSLECSGTSLAQEYLSGYAPGFGLTAAYSHYTPALVDVPDNSDLIEDWEFFYGLGKRMKLDMTMKPMSFSGTVRVPGYRVDYSRKPTSDELLEHLTIGSRIPLATVKEHAGGTVYPEPALYVSEADKDWQGRLNIANSQMMADLQTFYEELQEGLNTDEDRHAFRLISRRQINILNSTGRDIAEQLHGKSYNPAYMHPDDISAAGLNAGDKIVISSDRASIMGIVGADKNLRRGLISMTHCWGDRPELDDQLEKIGANTGRLTSVESNYESYTGMPRMSNIPVSIIAAN